MKYLAILILLISFSLSTSTVSLAQTDNTDESIDPSFRERNFLFGGIGPAIPLGDFGAERDTGFDLNTAISLGLKNNFFIRGMFDFSNFRFDRGAITQQVGTETYDVGGSNNLISLLAGGGYSIPAGRFTPYAFAGIGASFLSIPDLDIDENQNVVDISQTVGTYFATNFGAGIDFIINPPRKNDDQDKKNKTLYLFYLEAFYTGIPATTDASQHKFNLLTINVGIKTSM